jgi:hypothetical protein
MRSETPCPSLPIGRAAVAIESISLCGYRQNNEQRYPSCLINVNHPYNRGAIRHFRILTLSPLWRPAPWH